MVESVRHENVKDMLVENQAEKYRTDSVHCLLRESLSVSPVGYENKMFEVMKFGKIYLCMKFDTEYSKFSLKKIGSLFWTLF